jgi:hypothetical protein
MLFIVYALLTIAVLLVSAIVNGYALSVLWGWFIVPTFELPQLSVAAAIGLALTVSYVTNHARIGEKTPKTPYAELLVELALLTFLKPMLVLSLGYICTLFM